MRSALPLFALALAPVPATAAGAPGPEIPGEVREFVAATCVDCHDGEFAEGGLDFAALPGDLDDPAAYQRWVRVFDRVADGEMPPPEDYGPLDDAVKESFADAAGGWLRGHAAQKFAAEGRVVGRRLTAVQVERSLHAVLGIDIPLAGLFPSEPRTGGFTTVAAGQSMSHYDLENHLAVVDVALDEAFRRATTPPDEWTKELAPEDLARRNPKRRCREPEMWRGNAVVWSNGLVFYGRLPSTEAREAGWYRFSFDVSPLKSPAFGVWGTVRTGEAVSSAPLMADVATFRATGEGEPQTVTVEAWLPEDHMFEVRPEDRRLKKARTAGGQVGAGESQPQDVPGIALHRAVLSRVHRGPDDDGVRHLLFGDLELESDREGRDAELRSDDPRADLARLMRRFAERAFRRPVGDDEVRPYVEFAAARLGDGEPLLDAVRGGYRALLCSPRFLYLDEQPGELDGHALASRLSYFLWNAPPDGELSACAADGSLHDPAVLHGQVERMLAGERADRFAADFADGWLDLHRIDETEPDRRLHREFDPMVKQAMLGETRGFLAALLADDLSVSNLIDSDFALLNERLADYYGVDAAESSFDRGEFRRVPLDGDDPRGGLLTQGAVLKVTANGTTTSPVLRGVWVSERLLGEHVPPPPANVPAVEPDVRGARTIRELLAKHRSSPNCASCHVKVDPPGFALENFDAAGQWRSLYPVNGRPNRKGAEIDPSYETPDGESFADVTGFQRLTAADEDRLARNLAAQFIAYGTGAAVTFADRGELDAIVRDAAAGGHSVRDVLHAVVQSDIFRKK